VNFRSTKVKPKTILSFNFFYENRQIMLMSEIVFYFHETWSFFGFRENSLEYLQQQLLELDFRENDKEERRDEEKVEGKLNREWNLGHEEHTKLFSFHLLNVTATIVPKIHHQPYNHTKNMRNFTVREFSLSLLLMNKISVSPTRQSLLVSRNL
jgi:hypothetical protein